MPVKNSVLNVKALVGVFNQKKVLVVIVESSRIFVRSSNMQLVTCGSESMAPVREVSMSRVVLWRARRLDRQYPIQSCGQTRSCGTRRGADSHTGAPGHGQQGQQGAGIGEGEIY